MDSKISVAFFGIAGIAAVVLVIAIILVLSYNGMVSGEQGVAEKWAQVETQYQRRVDLIPNIVNTVKGEANFEQSTLTKITELRSSWQNASTQTDKVNAANGIESELSRLLLVFENYPQLKATQGYQDLMVELEGTENRVAFARGEYNLAVKSYNTMIKSLPNNVLSGMFGFSEKAYFESEEGASNAPDVNFQ